MCTDGRGMKEQAYQGSAGGTMNVENIYLNYETKVSKCAPTVVFSPQWKFSPLENRIKNVCPSLSNHKSMHNFRKYIGLA